MGVRFQEKTLKIRENIRFWLQFVGIDCSGDPFHKHVFLEHHLQSWCPPSGPIRHFMELVCAGLSKNPYMSSAKKVSTITWFQEYFERDENREILVHAGFWQDQQAQSLS